MTAALAILSRIWPHLLAAGAIIFAVWWIYSSGYERAEEKAEARAAKAEKQWNERVDRMEAKIVAEVSKIDANVGKRIEQIDITERTIIRPRLEREIVREVRFTDPKAGISDEMRKVLNEARALSGSVTIKLDDSKENR